MSGVTASLLASGACAVGILALACVQLRRQAAWDAARSWFELYLPHRLEASSATDFLRSLAGLGGSRGPLAPIPNVVFEVTSATSGRRVLLGVPQARAAVLVASLRAHLPGVLVTELAGRARPAVTAAVELTCHDTSRTLRTAQPEAASRGLAAALGAVRDGELIVWQWVVTAGGSATASRRNFRQLLSDRPLQPPAPKEVRDKHTEPVLAAVGRIGVRAGSPRRRLRLLRQAQAGTAGLWTSSARVVRRAVPGRVALRRLARAATPVYESGAQLNARELALILGWPLGEQSDRQTALLLPAPEAVPTSGRVLGYSTVVGLARPIGYSTADTLHHTHVLGPTGVGKSTLLANLAVQAISSGAGVVVIDPKADLVERILERVPENRRDDVIVLDPTDERRPVGMNLLEGAAAAPERVSDQVLGIFHRLFASSWGPRTADVLHASLLTLTQVPGMTLCELPPLLIDDSFRRMLLARVSDPLALDAFWAWYDGLTAGERAQVIAPVLNKARAFLLRRRVRNVIGQAEGTWSMEAVLNQRKILLVSLAKGELGPEAANLVGSLVVARLWQAIQRPAVRTPVAVFIDEFQDLVGTATDLAEVLAQARGFGVGITLAHQHLGQLAPDLRAAVLANARSRVVFQTASDDATVLARQLGGGLEPRDLTLLPARQAYAALCLGGAVQPPVSLTTLPLPEAAGPAEVVRAASRVRYGRDVAGVEAAIAGRRSSTATPGNLGRRRRTP